MKIFMKGLKRLRFKIHLRRALMVLLLTCSVGMGGAGVLLLVSKFTYIYGLMDKTLIILLGSLAAGLGVGILLRPSAPVTVRIADSLGYKERFVTAYEALLDDSPLPMQQLVIEDAIRCSGAGDFGKSYSLMPDKRLLYGFAAALILLAAAYFLPVQPSEDMQRQEVMHQRLDAALEAMQEEVDNSTLTQSQKREISAQLRELKNELSGLDNASEAVSSLMDTQAELKKLSEESENEQLKALSERLRQNPSTQEMGDLLKNGNIADFTEALADLNSSLDNMSQEELSALGSALSQAADSTVLDEDTRQLLSELGSTMQQELTQEQLAEVSRGLSELSDKINELAGENAQLREAVEKLNRDLAEAGEAAGGRPSGEQNSGADENGSAGEGDGSGAGSSGEGDTGGTGSGAGSGSIENADIYTSKAGDLADYDAELDSNGTATGEQIHRELEGGRGEMVPYTQVFDQYRDEALNSIESEDIPYGVRDIVRDYFSSLE